MKQYKLIIKETLSENLSGIVSREAKSGWRLNSYESSGQYQPAHTPKTQRRVVLVFEK